MNSDRTSFDDLRELEKARREGPVSRRELCEAIDEVTKTYGGSGYENRDLIADAFRQLVRILE